MFDLCFLNTDMYTECFDIIASELDKDSLFRLGVKLKLSYKDIDEIVDCNNKTYRKAYQILALWRDQSGQQTDLNQIVMILEDMNKKSVAEKIATKLHSSS